jgi:hypothetical protein
MALKVGDLLRTVRCNLLNQIRPRIVRYYLLVDKAALSMPKLEAMLLELRDGLN